VAKATKSKKNEESRRVGHDFYDLLIEEALVNPNEQGFERYRLITTVDLIWSGSRREVRFGKCRKSGGPM
jgi:hypothetical protein